MSKNVKGWHESASGLKAEAKGGDEEEDSPLRPSSLRRNPYTL
jgi:hypothetical protein